METSGATKFVRIERVYRLGRIDVDQTRRRVLSFWPTRRWPSFPSQNASVANVANDFLKTVGRAQCQWPTPYNKGVLATVWHARRWHREAERLRWQAEARMKADYYSRCSTGALVRLLNHACGASAIHRGIREELCRRWALAAKTKPSEQPGEQPLLFTDAEWSRTIAVASGKPGQIRTNVQ